MKMARSGGSSRWWILILCVILGSFLGVYLQGFQATENLFRNVVNIGFDIGDVDVLIARFGFRLFFRLNLGTFIGGVIGVLMIR